MVWTLQTPSGHHACTSAVLRGRLAALGEAGVSRELLIGHKLSYAYALF